VYFLGKFNFRLHPEIVQTLVFDESNEEEIAEQDGKNAPNFINSGPGVSDSSPVYRERPQMLWNSEGRGHVDGYQDRYQFGRSHEAEAVRNTYRTTHEN